MRFTKFVAVLAVGVPFGALAATGAGSAQASPDRPAQLVLLGSSGAGSRLQKIESAASREAKATFKLTYTSKGSDGTSSVTLEQKPPEQLFKSADGEVIFNGKKTYYCSTSGTTTCLVYSVAGASPLGSMMEVYAAGTYVDVMRSWQGLIAEHILGYRVSFSRARFAGQPSECVTWAYQGDNVKYCVTDSGVLAYVGSWGKSAGGTTTFALTSYSPRVNSSDFSVPRGATISTLP